MKRLAPFVIALCAVGLSVVGQPASAQGRFGDVRERPLGVKPGIARLPEIAPGAIFLPLAIEYSFWLERGAEACIAFGAPLEAKALLALSREDRRMRLEEALTITLDRLGGDVQARDPARFTALVEGRAGKEASS